MERDLSVARAVIIRNASTNKTICDAGGDPFLPRSIVEQMTGRRRAAAQCRELHRLRIPHMKDAEGYPLVLMVDIEQDPFEGLARLRLDLMSERFRSKQRAKRS